MVKGHYTYYLSPNHQRHFSHLFSKTLKNFAYKGLRAGQSFILPFLGWATLRVWADWKYHQVLKHHRP